MNDKMRAEFESAAEEHFWLQDLRGDYDKAEQEYLDVIVQTAWEGWQGSRAALVVELPSSARMYFNGAPKSAYEDGISCWHGGLNSARAAIQAAGVRVKP